MLICLIMLFTGAILMFRTKYQWPKLTVLSPCNEKMVSMFDGSCVVELTASFSLTYFIGFVLPGGRRQVRITKGQTPTTVIWKQIVQNPSRRRWDSTHKVNSFSWIEVCDQSTRRKKSLKYLYSVDLSESCQNTMPCLAWHLWVEFVIWQCPYPG